MFEYFFSIVGAQIVTIAVEMIVRVISKVRVIPKLIVTVMLVIKV